MAPPTHRPSGWRPPVKRTDSHYSSAAWQKTRARIKARDGFRCVKCGDTRRLLVDHVIPRRAGGTDDDANLRTLCHRCHEQRHAGPGRGGSKV
jgi:5-methylcytosine-specific restriction protein A